MTASEDNSPFIASEISDTSMLCMTTAVDTRRQECRTASTAGRCQLASSAAKRRPER